MICSRWPAARHVPAAARLDVVGRPAQRWVRPMMAFIGVRISWLMLAREYALGAVRRLGVVTRHLLRWCRCSAVQRALSCSVRLVDQFLQPVAVLFRARRRCACGLGRPRRSAGGCVMRPSAGGGRGVHELVVGLAALAHARELARTRLAAASVTACTASRLLPAVSSSARRRWPPRHARGQRVMRVKASLAYSMRLPVSHTRMPMGSCSTASDSLRSCPAPRGAR